MGNHNTHSKMEELIEEDNCFVCQEKLDPDLDRHLPCDHKICLKCMYEIGSDDIIDLGYEMPCPICWVSASQEEEEEEDEAKRDHCRISSDYLEDADNLEEDHQSACMHSPTVSPDDIIASENTLQNLPIEILDMILMKVILKRMGSRKWNKSADKVRTCGIIMELQTVWSEWRYRLTTRWFKIMFQRHMVHDRERIVLKKSRPPSLHPLLSRRPSTSSQPTSTSANFPRAINNCTDKLKLKLNINCAKDPVLLGTIVTAQQRTITGIAILKAELFIICHESSEVEVYSSIGFNMKRRQMWEHLLFSRDLGACERNGCLYVLNNTTIANQILRVDPNGMFIKKWWCAAGTGSLSVTDESNILLVAGELFTLEEYTPEGQLIRWVEISRNIMSTPLHALKLTNGHLLVSHCSLIHGDTEIEVSIVDSEGNFLDTYSRMRVENVQSPILPRKLPYSSLAHMAVDGQGAVLVADHLRDQVLLLSSCTSGQPLTVMRKLISMSEFRRQSVEEAAFPWRMVLDQSVSRLFFSREERVMIFKMK